MNLYDLLFNAPKSNWMLFAGFLIGILLFIILLEQIRKAAIWSQEVSRKLIHVIVGMMVVFTPYYFQSNRPLIWFALIFTIVDYIAIRTGRLKSMHGQNRVSYGIVYYPLSILILLITCWTGYKSVFMIAVLIMTLPDALAAIVGENLKNPHRYRLGQDEKSIEGSAVMFFSAWICVIIVLPIFSRLDHLELSLRTALWAGLITACMATAFEALSSKGSDNFTVPMGSAFILYFMLTHINSENLQLTLGLVLALSVAIFSYRIRFLNASGSVSTFILATLIFGAGGWAWTIPILTFFIISSALSKTGKKVKKQFETVFEKSDQRDVGQVLANGGLPGLLVILYTFFPHPIWYFGYLGALASVNADTWATELGILSKKPPRLITTGKPVSHGISGGITPMGLLGALAGSLIIVMAGIILQPNGIHLSIQSPLFWWIVIAGFFATLMDSLLGATLQGQYQCGICQQNTEKKDHCEQPTKRISGWAWMNNDIVNLICAISGIFFVFFGWISSIYG